MSTQTRLITDVAKDIGVKLEPSKGTELTLNILIHMFIMLGTLLLMFNYVVTSAEKKAITEEMTKTSVNAVDSVVDQLLGNLTDKQKAGLKKIVPFLQTLSQKYDSPNEQRDADNKALIKGAMYCLIVLAGAVVFWFIVNSCNKLDMARIASHVSLENLVMLVIVLSIEASFFLTVASKFVPVMPSQISRNIKDAIAGSAASPAASPATSSPAASL